MPVTSSAKKALRQNKKRYAINLARKKALKVVIKKFKKTLSVEDLSLAYKKLDKGAKAHIINKSKVSRLKSRLSQLIAKSKSAVS